ncbi:hypothetical protein [Glaciecola petra]|uniref:Transmembrane protein n=1 Tax=Glaciecola petra TaxID=3075602 RepID=A0ABU2ZR75_9ALTE|nr:hypothetical protein [Aestuariibacter sp. P117]MDT0595135.1 hypothetical protein [Aestuariibacter sp. P117]
MSTQKNNKRALIMMILVFVLPVLLAYMALQFDWFNKAATNRGELLQPVIEAATVLDSSDTKWHLVYVLPNVCDQACENAIYSIEQIYTATGKESDRVSMLFLQTENSASAAIAKVNEKNGTYLLQQSQENVNDVFKSTDINAIFISDTLHNVVLRYPVTANKDDAIMDSRNILADLKKLLKLSRIG